jgi:putative transposase
MGLHSDPGALKNLGHTVARSTVAKILRDNGIPPTPHRPSSWRTFLRAHWGAIAGADFFTTEVWTPRGLITYYTLFMLDLRADGFRSWARRPPRMRGSWRRRRGD